MSTYHEKKQHIYAYRRRKRAQKHISELNKIIEDFSQKDARWFLDTLNEPFWKIYEKLGWFDGVRNEARKSVVERKMESGETRFGLAAARYICPKCSKPGYLCSPGFDRQRLDLYVLHILWREEQVELCYIGKTKRKQILILTPPTEGILTLR